jgi:hypothetical protein
MRLFLILYVIIALYLNILLDNFIIFLFALSTFPVTIYLVLVKTKAKQRKEQSNKSSLVPFPVNKEKYFTAFKEGLHKDW